MTLAKDQVDAAIRQAVGKSLEDWLADGREAFRPIVAAMPDPVAAIIDRLEDQPAYTELKDALATAEDQTDILQGITSMAVAVLPLIMAAL